MARHTLEPYTGEQHAVLDELCEAFGTLAIDPGHTFLLVRPAGGRRGWIVAPDGRCVPTTRRYLSVDARERVHGPGGCHGAGWTDGEVFASVGLYPADRCPCGTYRIGDCAAIGWGAR